MVVMGDHPGITHRANSDHFCKQQARHSPGFRNVIFHDTVRHCYTSYTDDETVYDNR